MSFGDDVEHIPLPTPAIFSSHIRTLCLFRAHLQDWHPIFKTLKCLSELSLVDCRHFPSDSLQMLLSQSQFRSLKVVGVVHESVSLAKALSQKQPKGLELSVQPLTDEFLADAFGEKGHESDMVRLRLGRSPSITLNGLNVLASLPKLERLSIHDCKTIRTNDVFQYLQKRSGRSYVKIVGMSSPKSKGARSGLYLRETDGSIEYLRGMRPSTSYTIACAQ